MVCPLFLPPKKKLQVQLVNEKNELTFRTGTKQTCTSAAPRWDRVYPSKGYFLVRKLQIIFSKISQFEDPWTMQWWSCGMETWEKKWGHFKKMDENPLLATILWRKFAIGFGDHETEKPWERDLRCGTKPLGAWTLINYRPTRQHFRTRFLTFLSFPTQRTIKSNFLHI